MGYSHSEIVQRFKDGKTKGSASNMYIEGDVMYSYGHHFPLIVRTQWGYILNADKYSSSTSNHQSHCRDLATIQVPFTALHQAGIVFANSYALPEEFKKVDLVDHDEQRNDITGYKQWIPEDGKLENGKGEYKRIAPAQWNALPEIERETWEECTERRPEAAVLRKDDKYYLSSMDGQNYFISLLPEPVQTVAEAFESLKPTEVKGMTDATLGWHRGIQYEDPTGGQYTRQGEWFFTPVTELPIALVIKGKSLSPKQIMARIYKTMQHDYVLPRPDSSSHHHTATRGDMINGALYVSGSIRHEEHKMLRLSKADSPALFIAYRNRAVNSWSAGGRVD